MIVYTEGRASLTLDDNPIGKGFEGYVYKIPSKPQCCAKIYKSEFRNDRHPKISYMVNHIPDKAPTASFRICWPTEMVYDNHGVFLGFIMPLAFPNSISLYHISRMSISKELSANWNTQYNRNDSSGKGLINRLKVLNNIAYVTNYLHSLGYVFVDFKPQNIMITVDGRISMLDIDSIQINNNNKTFLCKTITFDYLPPELQHYKDISKRVLPKSCDDFALAVTFYEILFGIHPFAVSAKDERITELRELIYHGFFPYGAKKNQIAVIPQPHRRFENKWIPSILKELFLLAFDLDYNQRPTADKWGRTIYQIIKLIPSE